MRCRAEVVGLPVVEIDSGRVIGRVKDLVFDLGHGRLESLIVQAGRSEVRLPFDQVHSLGESAVTVGAEVRFEPVEGGSKAAAAATACVAPMGKRILSREGRVLGLVDDVIFDADSGAVWGYQVSAGLLVDFVEGKKAVPLTDELIVGPDSVVVAEDTLPFPEGCPEETEGGIQG